MLTVWNDKEIATLNFFFFLVIAFKCATSSKEKDY